MTAEVPVNVSQIMSLFSFLFPASIKIPFFEVCGIDIYFGLGLDVNTYSKQWAGNHGWKINLKIIR